MQQDSLGPFETIESAQDFMSLLRDSIEESRQHIERDLLSASAGREQRREQALQLTLFKVRQLASHVERSQRLLNDLRTLRRLLFAEREPRRGSANTAF
jgi:hypothetical protein